MSRWASSLNRAAAQATDCRIRGAWLLDLKFDSGHVRVNDSGADLSFGGNTFSGIGAMGTFDAIEESVEFVARGVRFELTGVDPGLIATTMTEIYQGRPALLYCGMLDENHSFVDTPELFWSGYMDTMEIAREKLECRIILQCEHRLRNAPPNSRFSDADQKARSSGDRFFDKLSFVAGYRNSWGGKSTSWNYKPGGGYNPG